MTAAAVAANDVYVTAISTSEVFVDITYQRACDSLRARSMARDWNPRLVGIVEVSDRGPTSLPRYAIIDGQHRWAAAQRLDPRPMLVANVHVGLTVADEAKLFDQLNRARKKVNVFEHYKARLASGDWIIGRIQAARRPADGPPNPVPVRPLPWRYLPVRLHHLPTRHLRHLRRIWMC